MNAKTSHTGKPVKIKGCSCEHAFQDGRYGVGNRVHNPCKLGTGNGYRCTVCGNEKAGE